MSDIKPSPQPEPVNIDVNIPIRTVVLILATFLLVHTAETLTPILMPLFFGVLLAVALTPVLNWMVRRHCPRSLAITIMTVALAGLIVGLMFAVLPKMSEEFTNFLDTLPKLKEDILGHLDAKSPLRPLVEQNLTKKTILPTNYDVSHFYDMGYRAMGGIGEVLLIFVFTIYLLIDGPRALNWFTAFFSLRQRTRLRLTFREVSDIVFAYAAGQFITSLLSFFYVLIVLSSLQVPGALLLATLAGVFDVLPVLGFFLAVFPAMLFALRISAETSVWVLVAYIFYHTLENYWIAPWIYGNRLRVSSFTVLIASIAAGFLAGIEGAIAVLPIVASYPVIERIWLKPYLGRDVVQAHTRGKE